MGSSSSCRRNFSDEKKDVIRSLLGSGGESEERGHPCTDSLEEFSGESSKTRKYYLDNGDTLPAFLNRDPREIEEIEKIGDGQWGPVMKARWLGKQLVAVKKFGSVEPTPLDEQAAGCCSTVFQPKKKQKCSSTRLPSSVVVKLLSREVTRLLRLRHPNVLHLFGFSLLLNEDLVLESTMIMELMDCNLGDYINKRRKEGRPVTLEEGLYIMNQIAAGMEHVHWLGYSHQDLNPSNVLVRSSGEDLLEVKIADFGCSEYMETGQDPRAGTLRYKAPEQLEPKASISDFRKLDVFSYAVLCSKILTGGDPYGAELEGFKLKEHIRAGNSPEFPETNLDPDVKALMAQCLKKCPAERPYFREICETLDRRLDRPWRRSPQQLELPVGSGESNSEQVSALIRERGFPSNFNKYYIHSQEISQYKKIGQGTDATVYGVIWKGNPFAGRCLPVRDPNATLDPQKRAQLERTIAFEKQQAAMLPLTSGHANLVIFHGFSPRENDNVFVMERMMTDLGQLTLARSANRERPYDKQTSRYIMTQIAKGMEFLHKNGTWHGDLHCSNILVSLTGQRSPLLKVHSSCLLDMVIKLSDFASDPFRCAFDYAAPDMLKTDQFGSKWQEKPDEDKIRAYRQWDVYSFGVLCFQLLTGEFPLDSVMRNRHKERENTILVGLRPELPNDTDADLKELIQSCWQGNPEARPQFPKICKILSNGN